MLTSVSRTDSHHKMQKARRQPIRRRTILLFTKFFLITSIIPLITAAQDDSISNDLPTASQPNFSKRKVLDPEVSIRQELAFEFRQFAQPSPIADHNQDGTVSWQGRYSHSWFDNRGRVKNNITIVPFARYNSTDSERSRFDLQSLSWSHVNGNWETRSGIRTVSWRTSEAIHLVDVINQTDLTGDVDGEDKLGQPMINVLWGNSIVSIELFILPGFRERIFPGDDARLRGPVPISSKQANYESGAGRLRTDVAVKSTFFMGNWELALSHFSGTSREPILLFENNQLVPYYPVIEQSGLEIQFAAGDWLWKLESISRGGFDDPGSGISGSGNLGYGNSLTRIADNTRPDRYEAVSAGFEFTWSGLGETGFDLGILSEYLWDARRDEVFANDIFVGIRLGLNDIQGTELLVGSIADLNHEEYLSFIEFSRRIGDSGRIDLTARFFDAAGNLANRQRDTDLFVLHDDDYLSLSYSHYF